MTPAAPMTGFGTGTAIDPNNPPQIEPSKLTLAPGAEPKQFNPLNEIESYYQKELGRAGDQGGLDYWTSQAKGGMSMEDIKNAINNSQEGQRFDINSLYKDELGREADTGGFDYWLSQLQGGMSLDDIRNQGFRASEEYKNRMPQPYPDPYSDPYTTPQPYVEPRGFGPLDDTPSSFDPRSLITGQPVLDNEPSKPYEPPKVSMNPFAGTGGPSAPYRGDDYDGPTMRLPYDSTQMDDFISSGKNTGSIQDLFGAGGLFGGLSANRGIIPQPKIDPVKDFVENLDQQPLALQRAFQQQLQRFGDPVQAARAVIGSLT